MSLMFQSIVECSCALAAVSVALLAGCSASPERAGLRQPSEAELRSSAEETLDRFHGAAARADSDAYFALFAPDGVFLGTEASERWSVADFRTYAEPYFSQGKGWTYVPVEGGRHLNFDTARDYAWFDELLRNEKYGLCRGSGVLRLVRDSSRPTWLIVQYNLHFPIPNELAGEITQRVRTWKQP
ncbi:MAG: nuclear transport factor 2 family protein [Planctomycetota bacterium]|nr:nuclear transport factor 2 family protein [Planctomycetota bacterium]